MRGYLRVAVETALLASVIGVLLVPYGINELWFGDSLNSQIWGLVNRFHQSSFKNPDDPRQSTFSDKSNQTTLPPEKKFHRP